MSLSFGAERSSQPGRLPLSQHCICLLELARPTYCCTCASHLAAVCRHKAHLSPGLLLDSPPKSSVHYSMEMAWLAARQKVPGSLLCPFLPFSAQCSSWNNRGWGDICLVAVCEERWVGLTSQIVFVYAKDLEQKSSIGVETICVVHRAVCWPTAQWIRHLVVVTFDEICA